MPDKSRMPSRVSPELNLFDKFASTTSSLVRKAPFFAAAVGVVLAWLIDGIARIVVIGPRAFLDQSYQLQINIVTTVVTFLLVALLQNTQSRWRQPSNKS